MRTKNPALPLNPHAWHWAWQVLNKCLVTDDCLTAGLAHFLEVPATDRAELFFLPVSLTDRLGSHSTIS